MQSGTGKVGTWNVGFKIVAHAGTFWTVVVVLIRRSANEILKKDFAMKFIQFSVDLQHFGIRNERILPDPIVVTDAGTTVCYCFVYFQA